MKLQAAAKINLGLDVVRKREDGYHEVRMVMQTVSLFDELTMTERTEPGVRLSTDAPGLPTDGRNLIVQAAELLMREFHITSGVEITLNKRIPAAAGLAGGSTDAAAALHGMNRIFRLGLTEQELMLRAVQIGADVPYCLMGGTALAEGIGELLTPLPPMPDCQLLIAKPDISVSTKEVYGALRAAELQHHPDIDGMCQAIRAGSLAGITERLENVLELVTVPAHPVIREIRALMLQQGAEGALMSGSGPTVFGVFEERSRAEAAGRILRERALSREVFLTRPIRLEPLRASAD